MIYHDEDLTNNRSTCLTPFQCLRLGEELYLDNFRTNYDTEVLFMFTGCSRKFQDKLKNLYKNIKPDAFNWF